MGNPACARGSADDCFNRMMPWLSRAPGRLAALSKSRLRDSSRLSPGLSAADGRPIGALCRPELTKRGIPEADPRARWQGSAH